MATGAARADAPPQRPARRRRPGTPRGRTHPARDLPGPPVLRALTATERRSALAVAAGLSVAAVAVAVIVRVGWAAQTRGLLHFTFAGVPARLDTALSIFAGNARLLGAV